MAAPDTVIIGGGASGLAAAITAARHGARVTVIERDVAAGLPILATGNGRCNISNVNLDPARYRYPDIARTVMGSQPEDYVRAFFDGLGLLMAEEAEGRLYPVTRRAESVRDVLLDSCTREGVALRCGAEVTAVRFDAATGSWKLTVSEPATPLHPKAGHDAKAALRNARKALAAALRKERILCAHRVIIACGGASQMVAKLFSLPHVPETPLLCPVAASIVGANRALEALDGLRVHAELALRRDSSTVWYEEGEILFRSYGISGIAAFNLSRRIKPGDSVLVDLFPQIDRDMLHELLTKRANLLGTFSTENPSWLDGLLAPALAKVVCKLYDTCHPGDHNVSHIVNICKHLKLAVTGTAEPQQAQVHRGGIPFDAVDLPSLTIRPDLAPALSVCGEACDMDADCGGYNLAWAWLSGIRAGQEAIRG